MACIEKYSCLYTKHIKQKRKIWNDGFLVFNTTNSKVTVKSEDGDSIESCFFRSKTSIIAEGEEITLERHLVQIEERCIINDKTLLPSNVITISNYSSVGTSSKNNILNTLNSTNTIKRCQGELNEKGMLHGYSSSINSDSVSATATSNTKNNASKSTCITTSGLCEIHDTMTNTHTYHEGRTVSRSNREILVLLGVTDKAILDAATPAITSNVSSIDITGQCTVTNDYINTRNASVGIGGDTTTPLDFTISEIDVDIDIDDMDIDEDIVFGMNNETEKKDRKIDEVVDDEIDSCFSKTIPTATPSISRLKSFSSQPELASHISSSSQLSSPSMLPSSPNRTSTKSPPNKKRKLNKPFCPPTQNYQTKKLLTTWSHDELFFPSEQVVEKLLSKNKDRKIFRNQWIPIQFSSLQHYKTTFTRAINETINLKLAILSCKFHAARSRLVSPKNITVNVQIQKLFRRCGLPVYFNCKLSRGTSFIASKLSRRNYEPSSDDIIESKRLFLHVPVSSKEHYSVYSKEDLWVISTSLNFMQDRPGEKVFLALSLFHSPSSTGVMEIQLLQHHESNIAKLNSSSSITLGLKLGKSMQVHALRGVNISSENSMFTALGKLAPSICPLLPTLLGTNPDNNNFAHKSRGGITNKTSKKLKDGGKEIIFSIPLERDVLLEMVKETIDHYHLNTSQCKIFYQFVENSINNTPISITLVRGVFGAVYEKFGYSGGKILISAVTNTAVDRILLGLLKQNFTHFLRVGSMARIAKPILPFTLHHGDKEVKGKEAKEREEQNVIRDLQELLKGDLSEDDRKYVLDTLKEAQTGNLWKRSERLKQVRVVGVTCAASVFNTLNHSQFSLVLLDECSQMIEPISLLAFYRFHSKHLVVVGDPMQLPPTLTQKFKSDNKEEKGLERTLYDRMILLGIQPIVLNIQYRLHPTLSGVVNQLFYNNELVDGVSIEQRAPLTNDLPALWCLDSGNLGTEEQDKVGSIYNRFEGHLVTTLLIKLLKDGLCGGDIGVIVFYKAQKSLILRKFDELHNNNNNNNGVVNGIDNSGNNADNIHRNNASELSKGDDVDDEKERREKEKEVMKELHKVQVSTVDAFQGGEKEVIILTTSRTQHLGFITNPCRLNVALTRAKRHLIVIGKSQILTTNPLLHKIISTSRESTPHTSYSHAKTILNRF